jgi:hypothetical protein
LDVHVGNSNGVAAGVARIENTMLAAEDHTALVAEPCTCAIATGSDAACTDQPMLQVMGEYQDCVAAYGVGHGEHLSGAIVAGHGWYCKAAHQQKQIYKMDFS